jgi:hypothetical protein
LIENVHEALAASAAPDKTITLVPCVAVIVPPPHDPVCPLGVVITRPAGSVSVNATPERSCVVFGLLIVKLNDVEPFSGILAAPNALLIVGGAATVMLAFDVLPVPPLVDVTCTLLFFTPAVVPVTFTETVQLAVGARLAPDRVTVDEPFAAVAVPLQLLVRFPGVATTRPAGRLSVNATPFRVRLELVLFSVKVRLVVPFRGTVAAPNALTIVGGLITVRFADEVSPVPASVESIGTLLLKIPLVVP